MAKKENTDRWFISISRLWVVAFVAFPLLWSACSGPKNEVVKGFEDAAEVPTLRTLDVMTLISDSGVTRYKIRRTSGIFPIKRDSVPPDSAKVDSVAVPKQAIKP